MRAIVFVLRGCPVGCLGAYGNEWVATPTLDRLAAEGVVFDRHISDSPDPAAAGRAWRSGRVQTPSMDPTAREEDGVTSDLLDRIRTAGVRTVLLRANHPDTDAPDPYYTGWDEVFDARPEVAESSPVEALEQAFPSLLDRLADVPKWLLWVETDRLMPPWDVPQEVFEAYIGDGDDGDDGMSDADGPVTPLADPPVGPFDQADLDAWEWLHSSFAAVVTQLDVELGRLFDQLRSRGLDRSAAWVVTSDLGYPLGEHGRIGVDRPWLHEELVHLPLIVRLPGAAEAGRRVPAFTQPPDLMPTLLDLFGMPIQQGADAPRSPEHGVSLLPLARGEAESVREAAVSGLVVGGVGEWAIQTADWSYLRPGPQPAGDPPREPQLYRKPDDRWEVNDLRPRDPDRADELDKLLGERLR